MESDSGVAVLTSSSVITDRMGSSREADKPICVTRSPYHQLEERVGRMERQLLDLNSLPSTKELLDSAGDERGRGSRPVADMWQGMQLSRKVDANTQGVSKVRIVVLLVSTTEVSEVRKLAVHSQGDPKNYPPTKLSINCIKLYKSLPMILDFD